MVNVVLLVLDTTRADHVGCYGAAGDPTPSIDSLATCGVRFSHAVSQSSWTKPSFASLFTGIYPYHISQTDQTIDSANITLAEILRDSGYFTIGVATNTFLKREYGLNQGFDIYLDDFESHCRGFRNAMEGLESWLEILPDKTPFFLFAQIFEPHFPYEPPADFRERYVRGKTNFADLYEQLHSGMITKKQLRENQIGMDSLDVEYFSSLYQAEIAYADRFVGRLCKWLREKHLAENTLVIITADHGESLGENGYFFEHGDYITEDQIHVPLIISYPRMIEPSRIIHETISLISLFPTILDLTDIKSEMRTEADNTIESQSVADCLLGLMDLPSDLPILSMSGPKVAAYRKGWKLIKNTKSGEIRFENLEPHKTNEEIGDSAMRSILTQDISAFLRGENLIGSLSDLSTLEDHPDLPALRALGYID